MVESLTKKFVALTAKYLAKTPNALEPYFVVGDFVAQSYINGTCIGVVGVNVGINSNTVCYTGLNPRRRVTHCIRLVDKDFTTVPGKYRVVLHFKSDK